MQITRSHVKIHNSLHCLLKRKNWQKTGNSPRAKPYMEALKSTQAKLSPKEEEFNHCVRRSFAHLNRATARANSGGISGDALLSLEVETGPISLTSDLSSVVPQQTLRFQEKMSK